MAGGLLGIGSSALLTAYTQLQTTGHNIANVNTPGYSRQEVLLASAGADFTGAGFVGRGVSTVDVRRRYDRFVNDEVATTTAASAADKARIDQLARLDKLFSDPSLGIGASFDDMSLAMADVVNRPSDPSGRAVVIARADTLASRVRSIDQSIAQLTGTVEGRIGMAVQSLNDSLSRLARLNGEIAGANASSVQPNDLLDQRDRLLVEINQSMKATAYIGPDGSASVFAVGGQALVVGSRNAQVLTESDPADPTRSRLVLGTDNAKIPFDAKALGGGALAGLLRVRDQDLASVRNRIGQLAATIADAYNTQQRAGVDATGAAGTDLFRVGNPVVTPAGRQTGNAQFSLAVSDASKLQASDYQLEFDGSNYKVTRLSDGALVQMFAPPGTGSAIALPTEGLTLTLDSGAAGARDRFTMRSASVFAREFERTLPAPAALATGISMVPTLGSTNRGTLRVAEFTADPVATASTPSLRLDFTSATSFDVPGASPPLTNQAYTPGQPINIGGWTLTLGGVPQANDTVTVVPNTAPAMDNRNARHMAELPSKLLTNGATISESYGTTIADVGTRTQSAQAAHDMSKLLLDQSTAAREAVSGVNLDEEAARLLQFQQSYQAAAKVIQTVQAMFQSLLEAAG